MRLALDIGGTFVKCAAVTDSGDILNSASFPTNPVLATDDFARSIVEIATGFIAGQNAKFDMVGAGMAGFTDGKRGIVLESPNIPNVRNLELAKSLRDGLGLPSYADNDATVAAWGEYLFGGHGDVRDLLVVTLGTGIGGGLVLDGKLYRGARGMAGEFGQMTLYPGGPKCPGGGKGCLEHYIGKAGLINDYKMRAALDKPVEPDVIHKRAVDGDQFAIDAWNHYGRCLGISLADASNLLDLGMIVLTGGVAGAFDVFSAAMNTAFRQHLITPHKDVICIIRTTLGGNAGILGAAFLDQVE